MHPNAKAALEKVAGLLKDRGFVVARATLEIPDGTRELLVVDEETVVVHPKDKPALYRLRNELRHGIRERTLEYYAERDWLVIVYEEDTGSVLLGAAPALYAASQPWVTAGAVEGADERVRFVPRAAFTVIATGV